MRWNPNGSVLAFNIAVDGLFKKGRYLGVSYDNGKNIIITDIIFRTYKMIWTNPETLYIANGGKIIEIDVSNKKRYADKEIFSGEIGKVRLFGQIDGSIVYRSDNDIYCDKSLLYKSEHEIYTGMTDGDKIGFKTKEYIFIIDDEGKVIHKKSVEKKVVLFGISDVQNCIYLMRDNQLIQQYNYIEQRTNTLFDINFLEEN